MSSTNNWKREQKTAASRTQVKNRTLDVNSVSTFSYFAKL